MHLLLGAIIYQLPVSAELGRIGIIFQRPLSRIEPKFWNHTGNQQPGTVNLWDRFPRALPFYGSDQMSIYESNDQPTMTRV